MKIAIIGCGKIADAHAEEIKKISSVQMVAACDLEPIMAEQLSVRYAIPRRYTHVGEMLKIERPDVVHITTPPESHLALVRQAFEAGCDVFLEKPASLRHCETAAIVGMAIDQKRKLAVNYWPNFEVQALELRSLFESGVLGTPIHIESYYGYDLAGDYGTSIKQDPNHWVRRMPGKLFQNVLDHIVNKITPFIDDDRPFIHSSAYCGDTNGEQLGPDRLLDELRVFIRGAKTSAYATFSAHARPVGNTLRVYGSLNTAHVDFNARTIALERKQAFPSALGRLFPPFQVARDYMFQGFRNVGRYSHARFHFFDGMHNLLTEFYHSIESHCPLPIAYSEILRVSAIIDTVISQVYPEVST